MRLAIRVGKPPYSSSAVPASKTASIGGIWVPDVSSNHPSQIGGDPAPWEWNLLMTCSKVPRVLIPFFGIGRDQERLARMSFWESGLTNDF